MNVENASLLSYPFDSFGKGVNRYRARNTSQTEGCNRNSTDPVTSCPADDGLLDGHDISRKHS